MQRHAVHDGGHAELAHAIRQVVAPGVTARFGASFEVGQVGAGEVGAATKKLGQQGGQHIQRVLAGFAGGHRIGLGHDGGQRLGQTLGVSSAQIATHAALELGGILRVQIFVVRKQLVPLGLGAHAARGGVPSLAYIVRDLKGRVRPVQGFAGGRNFGSAQGSAMHIVGARLVGRAHADHGFAANQGRAAVGVLRLRLGRFDGGMHGLRVVAIYRRDHVPAIGLKALGCVVGEPAFHMAVDRDAVVVVQRHQLGQAQRARQRTGFMADALHQTTVAQKHIGHVVHDVQTAARLFAVERLRQHFFGQRHAHRVGDALAQWAGGGFHARGDVDLGVARGLAVQLAKLFQLRHGQLVAGQVQQGIDQHRAVPVGQHKAVAVGPLWVEGVVLQVAVPQHFGNIGHAHGRAGVAGFGGFHRIHGQHAHGVGHALGHLGCGVWRGQGGVHRAPPVQAKPSARLRRSIMRQTKGVKISCMAISILPPGTTMVLARLIQESLIMLSK